MLLVVDVGNTQTHFGTYRGDELVEHWRFATVRESTADELGARLRNLLALRDLSFADIDASILSSTVPQLRPGQIRRLRIQLSRRERRRLGRRTAGHVYVAVRDRQGLTRTVTAPVRIVPR